MFASKKRVKEVTAEEALLPQTNLVPPAGAQPVAGLVGANVNQAKLLLAKQMAAKINKNLENEKQVRNAPSLWQAWWVQMSTKLNYCWPNKWLLRLTRIWRMKNR